MEKRVPRHGSLDAHEQGGHRDVTSPNAQPYMQDVFPQCGAQEFPPRFQLRRVRRNLKDKGGGAHVVLPQARGTRMTREEKKGGG